MNGDNRRYIVAWQAPNGESGRGEQVSRETAHAWAKYANEVQPEILHRVYYLDADGVTLWLDTVSDSGTSANALPLGA